MSDYAKGVLTKTLTQKIISISNQYGKKLIFDPKSNFSKYKDAFMVKPNKKELSILASWAKTKKLERIDKTDCTNLLARGDCPQCSMTRNSQETFGSNNLPWLKKSGQQIA